MRPSTRGRALAGALAILLAAGAIDVTQPSVVGAHDGTAAALEAQVASGRLDAAVLGALWRDGRTDAVLNFRPPTDGDPNSPAVLSRWKAGVNDLLQDEDGLLRDYPALRSAFVRFTSEEQLLATLRDAAVEGVHANRAVQPADVEAHQLIRQPQAVAAGYRGAGVSVAVLDTGADYRRAALGSCTAPRRPASCRVVVARDFAPQDNRLDAVGHGTAVSEVVVAVAPSAKLLALDVFRADGLAYDSDLLAAIDWLVRKGETWNVRAINLSVADPTHWLVACPLSGLAPAFEAAIASGLAVVVASGNGGMKAGVYVDGIAYPACVPGALSVGGVYDADIGRAAYATCTDASTAPDRIACFSQGGQQLDMLAPAALISAAGLSWSGTSLAAPHVAAAAAVMAGAMPGATAERIAYVLRTSGRRILDARNGLRRDRLNVYAATSLIRDARRPTVLSRSPEDGASDVATSSRVIVRFSEDVSGVSGDTMTLRTEEGLRVQATVAYDPEHRRATLRPTGSLLGGTTYTATLTAGIRDAAGNRLRTTAWSFTTAG